MIAATYHIQAGQLALILDDLAPPQRQAARDLAFAEEGGRFVRRFPAADAALAAAVGERFVAHAEALVLQTGGLAEVPWEQALAAWLGLVGGLPIFWWLGGSAALAVRGLAVRPRDFDIITDDAGAQQLGAALQAQLIEPVVPVEGWICRWFGRAFLHARFEWVGGVEAHVDQPEPGDFGPAAAARLEPVRWRGHTILVPPLAMQLAVSERRGLAERAALIRAALA